MSQPITHDHPQREYKSYKVPATDDSPEYEFQAHTVTDDTAGRVQVPGGVADVRRGDVLVPTERGDVFHVLPADALKGLTSRSESSADASDADKGTGSKRRRSSTVDSRTVESDDFGDPADHNAQEVKRRVAFLRENGRDADADSLVDAERNGKNRKSALS